MKIKGLFIVMVAGALACLLLTGCKNGKNGNEAILKELGWQEKNGKWGMVDKDGNVVVPYEYDWIDTCLILDQYQLYGCLDVDVLCVGKGEKDKERSCFKEDDKIKKGLKAGGKYGVIDMKGNVIIPLEYEDFEYNVYGIYFEGGLIAKKDGKWGVINEKNEAIIPFEYDYINTVAEGALQIFTFDDNLAVAKKDSKWGVINENNEVIIPFEYDTIEANECEHCIFCHDGKARVKKDGKEGYINKKGEFTEGKAEQTNTIDDNPNW